MLSIEILVHSPYSPDLASWYFYLSRKIKELQGKWLTDADEAVAAYEKAVEATQSWSISPEGCHLIGDRIAGQHGNKSVRSDFLNL
ncbi:hypothetical protein EVAR_66902_1 [Eumeta japonica]|uniref:Mariner Mos1 transposase n=1 Tax=Eumeta variegata TaxID=151549 RepID=A0A4C1Z7Q6_EUMVA|nr:hypothetical protein EVAR_66902_1 [Eumeta japonica]